MPQAVIVDAIRTPIGKFGGALLEHTARDLAIHVIRALLERNAVPAEAVDEVILGQVIQGGSGPNVARTAALAAGLPETVCAFTVNKVCASGMKAIALARQAVLLGEGGTYIAGGVESMSNAPYYTTAMRWGKRLGSATLTDAVADEALSCSVTGESMGLAAEQIAARTGITREQMDAWALRSQERAAAAVASGRFAQEIVPVPVSGGAAFDADEHPRKTSSEALARLRPAFRPDGCVTAGNSSGINDGAAALLVAEQHQAARMGWRARAAITAVTSAGARPLELDLAPVAAVHKLCARMGVAPEAFDLVEINEAFAVQTCAVVRKLGLDEERVNVNGGAVALGHPIGASGARIVVTLLNEMEKRDVHLGLAALCIGGGMGMAMALER